jgi:glycine oxidase
MTRSHDVVIIGAGAIGCAAAWRLAQRGLEVLVLDKSAIGEEAASCAAAGMLSAQLDSCDSEPMAALCMASRERYRRWVPELCDVSGIDVDHRECGALKVTFDRRGMGDLERLIGEQRRRGWRAEWLSGAEARALEPELGDVLAAAHFPGECAIEPRALLSALAGAAQRAGARFQTNQQVTRIVDRGVRLANGERISAGKTIIACGAWSGLVGDTGIEGGVVPIRGQMLELHTSRPPALLVEAPEAYLSPRSDGRVVVGSTLEDVGFERAVTASAAASLLAGAVRVAPGLADAKLVRHWCGFRARASDALPILGSCREDMMIATAHYRNGIVLTPATADLIVAWVMAEPLPADLAALDLAPFSPGRCRTG